jgi:WD40 repeat protein
LDFNDKMSQLRVGILLILSQSLMKLQVTKAGQLTGHSGPIYAIAAGTMPNTVFTGSGDNFVASWNLGTMAGEKFAVKMESTVYSICHVAAQHLLLVGDSQGGIHIIDLEKKEEVRYFTHHSKGIYDLQYLPETGHFYAVSGDGSFSVWDLASLELLRTIPLCEEKLRDIAFSADGKTAAIACGDGTVRIFDTELHNELHTIAAHEIGANAVAFHPNGKFLVSGGRDAHLNVWNISENYAQALSIPAHNFAIYSIAFSPDGTMCATGSRDKSVKIWDATSFDVMARLDRKSHRGHLNSVNKIFWSADNDYLVSVSDDRSLIAWKIYPPTDEI